MSREQVHDTARLPVVDAAEGDGLGGDLSPNALFLSRLKESH